MPSFADDIVLAILALLLFGPKKLPVLARELGKWVAEFRRASNEFKYQMEEELRLSEQAERQQKLAAIEAAAPAPALPEADATRAASEADAVDRTPRTSSLDDLDPEGMVAHQDAATGSALDAAGIASEPGTPVPIATSSSLTLMPPDTGLPISRGSGNPMNAVLNSIPTSNAPQPAPAAEPDHDREEHPLHAD